MSALTPREVVAAFFDEVRSGRSPERASLWMAESVQAHQVQSEAPAVVTRTPNDYAEHVREMWAAHGPFTLCIETMLAEGNQVYVRWRQDGWLRAGETLSPLVEVASAVYEVAGGRIVAYHVQIDRLGLQLQECMAGK